MASFQPNWTIDAANAQRAKLLRSYCAFCIKNGRSFDCFSSHMLKTNTGRVVCPELRSHVCPICHATGDNAHTRKFCPDREKFEWGAMKKTICNYCKKNGEPFSIYGNHILKDSEGNVKCPNLRRYVCSLCGATGDSAHSRTYCPITIAKNNGIRPIAPCLLMKTKR